LEPQANVLVKLASGVRLDIGAGCRMVGSEDDFDDRLRGATRSTALGDAPASSALPAWAWTLRDDPLPMVMARRISAAA
jgi:hypothetical protein